MIFLTMFDELIVQGGLTLSFFERRATRQLFGLVSNEEKVTYVDCLPLCQDCVCYLISRVLTSFVGPDESLQRRKVATS